MGRWIAYGHPGWETEVGTQFSGAEYQIQVGRRPVGRLGGDVPAPNLHVERYAPVRTTPFPGLESHGEDAWYADGLPRSRYYQGEEILRCGARIWQTEGGIGIPDVDDAPDYLLTMSGGGEGGGHMDVGTDCWIFYGGCLHVTGGGEGGGAIPMYASESFDLAGGGEGGGTIPTDGSEGFALSGGGEGGGAMPLDAADSLHMTGGGEGGGEIAVEPYSPVYHDSATIPFTDDSPVILDFPAVIDGDLVLVLITSPDNLDADVPDGWTLLTEESVPPFDNDVCLIVTEWHLGDPTEVELTFTTDAPVKITITTISNPGAPSTPVWEGNDTSIVDHPGITLVPPGALVILYLDTFSNVGLDTPFTDFTEGFLESGEDVLTGVWYLTTEGGTIPPTDGILTDGVEWVAGMFFVEPVFPITPPPP